MVQYFTPNWAERYQISWLTFTSSHIFRLNTLKGIDLYLIATKNLFFLSINSIKSGVQCMHQHYLMGKLQAHHNKMSSQSGPVYQSESGGGWNEVIFQGLRTQSYMHKSWQPNLQRGRRIGHVWRLLLWQWQLQRRLSLWGQWLFALGMRSSVVDGSFQIIWKFLVYC